MRLVRAACTYNKPRRPRSGGKSVSPREPRQLGSIAKIPAENLHASAVSRVVTVRRIKCPAFAEQRGGCTFMAVEIEDFLCSRCTENQCWASPSVARVSSPSFRTFLGTVPHVLSLCMADSFNNQYNHFLSSEGQVRVRVTCDEGGRFALQTCVSMMHELALLLCNQRALAFARLQGWYGSRCFHCMCSSRLDSFFFVIDQVGRVKSSSSASKIVHSLDEDLELLQSSDRVFCLSDGIILKKVH